MEVIYDGPTVFFFAWIVATPLLAYLSYRKIRSGKPLSPVRKRMAAGVSVLLIITLSALQAGASNHVSFRARISAGAVAFGGFLLSVLVYAVWKTLKRKPERAAQSRRLFGTSTPAELTWAMALALTAGVGEEIIFRGVLYQLLERQFGNVMIAAVLCVVIFAVGHATQGLKGIVFSAYLAICLHYIVIVFGSIIVAMIVHTLYDAALFAMLYQRKVEGVEVEAQSAGTA